MKTRLQKFEIVNGCSTLKELANKIRLFSVDGFLVTDDNLFIAEELACECERYDAIAHDKLPEAYGIRQRAIYILFIEGSQ